MGEIEDVSEAIYQDVRQNVIAVQGKVAQAINSSMVLLYWEIGRRIHLACDGKRAEYGMRVLKTLSDCLVVEFGKKFSERNLRLMRQFYEAFPIVNALRSQLSWTHYRMLMRVKDSKARTYYLRECAAAGWTSRELERQITTFAYQRTLSHHAVTEDKGLVPAEAATIPYRDFIRDPYVLEFLDLKASPEFYEKDIEQGIIRHLRDFLLELGRGFSFVAEQKHLSIDGDDFYIDLVFYNYILKCFVLIDLKLGKLKHQDIGQMQMYVNYYAKEQRNPGDNHPIGIILCAEKNDAVIKYTLGDEKNLHIYAAKYMPYMPTAEELRQELHLERLRDYEDEDAEGTNAPDEKEF